MKQKSWLPFFLFVTVLVLVSVACEFSASTANITNAHMATTEADTSQTSVYSPVDPTFYCFFELNNAPDDTVIRGVWTLIAAEGFSANSEIDSAEVTGGSEAYSFSLDRSVDEWPVGQYKIDLYLNGELAQTVNFEVK